MSSCPTPSTIPHSLPNHDDDATEISDTHLTNTSEKKKCILITNGESYLGRALAIFIADQLTRREGQLKKKHRFVKVLCEDKEKVKDLKKRGIEVEQVDYESQSTLRENMRGHIKTVIFNPFTESARLVSHGKNLLDAAAHEKIKRIMMISSYGCSFYHEKESPIGQFNLLEEQLRRDFRYGSWVVYRIPFIQQYFYFWASMIENKSIVGLPISDLNFLETAHVKDICEAVSQAALSKKFAVWYHQQDLADKDKLFTRTSNIDSSSSDNNELGHGDDNSNKKHVLHKRVYEIKSTLPMTPGMVAQSLNNALQEEGYDAEVEHAIITDEQLECYLKKVSEEGSAGAKSASDQTLGSILLVDTAKSSLKSDAGAVSGSCLFGNIRSIFGSGGLSKPTTDDMSTSSRAFLRPSEDDRNFLPCPPEVLTPFCIKLIIDHFRVSRCPEVPMIPTNDVRDITGRDPVQLTEFFMANRRQFCPNLHY